MASASARFLALEEELDAVAATGPEEEDDDAFVAIFLADDEFGLGIFLVELIDVVLVEGGAEDEGDAEEEIEKELGQGDGNGEGAVKDQDGEDPVEVAIAAVGKEGQAGHKDNIEKAGAKEGPLQGAEVELLDTEEDNADDEVDDDVGDKEPFEDGESDGGGGTGIVFPMGKEKEIGEDQDQHAFEGGG